MTVAAVAEHDAAVKQVTSMTQELSQLRESSAALQQQLHVMTLEKQAEAEKAAKVECDSAEASIAAMHSMASLHCNRS